MSKYAKALTPLVVGIIIGTIFLLTGDTVTGKTVLLAAVAAAGIVYRVPNS